VLAAFRLQNPKYEKFSGLAVVYSDKRKQNEKISGSEKRA
jgi:hypothetical protein